MQTQTASPSGATEPKYKPWELPPLPGETPAELAWRRNLAYFEYQHDSVREFWRRIPTAPDLRGKKILELGCGHGTLSVGMAQAGAAEVWGFDLDDERISFAERHVPAQFPEYASAVHFRCEDICDYLSPQTEGTIDIIVSKDTFEHIIPLNETVEAMRRLLKPGGYAVIGTSPLYYSPFGDHGWYLGPGKPWSTLIPEPILFKLAGKRAGRPIRSAHDMGLNKMTPADFRRAFPATDWRTKAIDYNQGGGMGMKAFRVLRRIGPLEPIFTTSIYTVMERIR
ncbi:class I SAM-dependent methyltransferase [Novosphingobium sp. M1R2S20]|uniref:Class I SAM-dependent methyltransferase n=1 Tax=Novosphingobium rhizovicinum TaxID=3228928 RepID=A0ABV3RB62_9SPHN